ncbi:hypothetical protein BASA62_001116 [Batrachochytrium salamandrivorans]|nr:hypothetical protein BASA62_001116 [Batrachochytrium salamandrivorans]
MGQSHSCGGALKVEGFVGRMIGNCTAIQKQYEDCMDGEFEIRRQENHALARQRTNQWKELNKEMGLE